MDLSDLEIYAIHIHTVEEATQVFEYYSKPENGGYTHKSVGAHNCLEYPYLMPSTTNRHDIMGATGYEGWTKDCVEFSEWLDYVNPDTQSLLGSSAEDITSFIGILGVNT